jgi:6,7-dimethyl-8-ribityllumazine synthase
MSKPVHILVIESPYYKEIAAELYRGAKLALDAAGATHDVISVPGVLELPAALAMAMDSELDGLDLFGDNDNGDANATLYDGYVVLGCVIRGETTHYDIVAGESARALMDLSIDYSLALGNGIQTVENEAQAWTRANVDDKNKGGGAAEAALAMIALRNKLKA